jgi:DNA modification methylase
MRRSKERAEKSDTFAVEIWPIDRPVDYPKNARKWSGQALAKVGASIKEFGWRQPVVVDSEGVIIIGHLRRAAGREAGLPTCPVHIARDLSPAKVRALRLADNRTHEEAAWDLDILTAEMLELRELDLDLSLTGFDSGELDRLLGPTAGLTDPDEVPPVPDAPVSRLGDLWLMGGHRVLCGDCTDVATVTRLMEDERAGLMNIDPPYGVGYANDERPNPGMAKPRVAGDQFQDRELQGFLESSFTGALTALRVDAAWYLWHAHLTQGFFAAAAAAAAQVILHRQIIWVKPVLLLGRGQYHWKHEPCFMGWIEGNRPPDYGDRTETTVWQIGSVSQSERKAFDHSTPKPVGLFELPIRKHLLPGEICYDSFAGTGPQFIAAESLGRRCYGLEIEPKYVDVIVQRWQNFTGREATLEGNGATFEEVKRGRQQETEDAIKDEVIRGA